MNDPNNPYSNPGDPSNPARDPNSDIFSSSPPPPEPSSDPYQVIDPNSGQPVDAGAFHQPHLDPAMMAPPPLNPPIMPGAILGAHHGGSILTLGIVSIVCGVIGAFCCALLPLAGIGCGIAAILWGNSDLRAMDANLMDPSGRSSVSSGRVCGIVGIVISSLGMLFMVAMIILQVAMKP